MKELCWGYSDAYRGQSGNRHNNVRWIGRCTISRFIGVVMKYGNPDNAGHKWIRDRMGDTRSTWELSLLAQSNYSYIICYDTSTREILEVVEIDEKQEHKSPALITTFQDTFNDKTLSDDRLGRIGLKRKEVKS